NVSICPIPPPSQIEITCSALPCSSVCGSLPRASGETLRAPAATIPLAKNCRRAGPCMTRLGFVEWIIGAGRDGSGDWEIEPRKPSACVWELVINNSVLEGGKLMLLLSQAGSLLLLLSQAGSLRHFLSQAGSLRNFGSRNPSKLAMVY